MTTGWKTGQGSAKDEEPRAEGETHIDRRTPSKRETDIKKENPSEKNGCQAKPTDIAGNAGNAEKKTAFLNPRSKTHR